MTDIYRVLKFKTGDRRVHREPPGPEVSALHGCPTAIRFATRPQRPQRPQQCEKSTSLGFWLPPGKYRRSKRVDHNGRMKLPEASGNPSHVVSGGGLRWWSHVVAARGRRTHLQNEPSINNVTFSKRCVQTPIPYNLATSSKPTWG